MLFLQIIIYLAAIVFIAANFAKGYRIAKAPKHLRWELYPLPHEKGKSAYGGSRLEEHEWWTKVSSKDFLGEFKYMLSEIFLLKTVWEKNRPLWFGSFCFHTGIYIIILVNFMFLITGTALVPDIVLPGGFLADTAFFKMHFLSFAGGMLLLAGSLNLFFSRLVDVNLRLYSAPGHYFNLAYTAVSALLLIIWAASDPDYINNYTATFSSLVTLKQIPGLPLAAFLHLFTLALFAIYLPFTHMTHFFTKYFTYHQVRWEDEPNKPGSPLAGKLNGNLMRPVTWAAPHIAADGRKNWIVIAAAGPKDKDENEE